MICANIQHIVGSLSDARSNFGVLLVLLGLSVVLFLLSFYRFKEESFWADMPKWKMWPFSVLTPSNYRVGSLMVIVLAVIVFLYLLCK
jgi:hypothetical protein